MEKEELIKLLNDMLEELNKEEDISDKKLYQKLEEDEKEKIKWEILGHIKDAKYSILFATDNWGTTLGTPASTLATICCVIENLKKHIDKDIIEETVKLALNR